MAGKSTISITFKLDGDGKGFKNLANDANGLKTVMTAAITEANKLDKSIINWSQSVQAIGAVNNAISQLNGTLNSITEESRQFGAAMKAANTMAGKDAAGFVQLKGQVEELSKSIPMAREQLANGLYQVVSNGVPEDNWISFLNKSARSAVGGIADVGEVVKVTSTVIKNYGMEWEAAGDIQDKIQLTAKNGVTSFEQLAAALPSVTGQAAQLGVSFTEMLAVMSTLTGVTGNTSEVATQLASVLTALTKESSKSQKMAEAMGIQFNAASIKAAGGLRNYLKELDSTITAYAAKTGELKESIYSKLFGRAEALRLINGLTGELAEKFDENIKILDNSAGTIDKAFEEMSSTGSATTQMLKNQFGAFTDLISGIVGGIQPVLNFTAQLGMTTMSVMALRKSFAALNITMGIAKVRTFGVGIAAMAMGGNFSNGARYIKTFTVALRSMTASATAAKFAIRGLMVASGVGLLVVGVTWAIEKLINAFDDVPEAADEANKAIDSVAETAKSTKEVFEQTQADTYSSLMTKYKQLQVAWKALSTAHAKAEWVRKNKKEFEQLGIKVDNVTDAENVFEKNTTAVVNAFIERAKAAARLAQLTEEYRKQMELADKIAQADEAAAARHPKVKAGDVVPGSSHTTDGGLEYVNNAGQWVYTDKGAAKENSKQWIANDEQTKNNRKALKESQARSARIEKEVEADANRQPTIISSPTKDGDGGDGGNGGSGDPNKDKIIEGAKSYADLSHNVEVYKKQLESTDPAQTETIAKLRQQMQAAENAAQAAKDLMNGWNIETPDTIEEVDEAINRQQALRKKATAENIAGIDSEIERLQGLKKQMERASYVPTPIDEIKTYEQLNRELSRYTEMLQTANDTERKTIQTQINALNELKAKWDDVLSDLKKPGSISTLDTVEKLDDAITYYGNLQKKQTSDEIANTQRTINALEAKRKALQRGMELPSMKSEADEINSLSSRELKVEVRAIGFDELTRRIKELNKQLNDIENPVTDSQRKDIEEMIATYERWRQKSISAFDTAKNGWGGIKGIGNSIQGITDALQGNGNAWQKTVALIDAFIGLYEGIQAVVGIINLLTAASNAHAITKGVEAGAETTEAATRTAATTSNIAASTAQIVANKLETASWAELAAAMTIAAHAYIPFSGVAIAAGMIAAQQALIIAAGIPKFADGAIAYGPTLGLFGEYAGASSNPEVVAPLDKLKSMIEPHDNGIMDGQVLFRIKGRELVGIYQKEKNLNNRT